MKSQRIKPLHPTAGKQRCSILDVLYAGYAAEAAFVFPQRLDPERLARSLSQVLSDFPTYAGRLSVRRDGFDILHDADGALFEHVETQSSLAELITAIKAERPREVCPYVSVGAMMFRGAALFCVRLTNAPDGAVIGIRCNHMMGDLNSLMLLLRAWAAAYGERPYVKPLIAPDQDAYLSEHLPDIPGARPAWRVGSWRELAEFAYATAKPAARQDLVFPKATVKKIREAYSTHASVSTNDAVSAHLYSIIRHFQQPTTPNNLCITLNYRSRAGLPDNLVGNLVTVVAQPVGVKMDAAATAAGLRRQLDEFGTKGIHFHATRRALEARPGWLQRIRTFSEYFQPGRGDFMVGNWRGFDLYGIPFGDIVPTMYWAFAGAPAWNAGIGDAADGDGLLVILFLPKKLSRLLQSKEARALLFDRIDVPRPVAEQQLQASL